jgi:anthranilate phosphoribosyltransferase
MFSTLIEKLGRREDLTTGEAAEAMAVIMRGDAAPAQIAGLLIGLAMKGERPSELVGFAQTMRAQAVALSKPVEPVFDTCGTGGDRSGTFNISTAAALTLAACGVRVAKHGNRSVSSRCGSADVLETLGVNVAASPAVVERCLHEVGIAFFFAPTFHPAMRHAAPARRDLGVRTAFNLLGPLTNPARASRQLVGVPRPELTELVARALMLLGSERAWVVHGADGIDELSTTGYSKVSECRDGAVQTFYVHPADCGLAKASLEDLKGGDAADNAARIREVLDGVESPSREIVLLNAGAALFVAGHALTLRDGITKAAAAIDSGAARDVLARLVEASRDGAGRSA